MRAAKRLSAARDEANLAQAHAAKHQVMARAQFSELDADGDGVIRVLELRDALLPPGSVTRSGALASSAAAAEAALVTQVLARAGLGTYARGGARGAADFEASAVAVADFEALGRGVHPDPMSALRAELAGLRRARRAQAYEDAEAEAEATRRAARPTWIAACQRLAERLGIDLEDR